MTTTDDNTIRDYARACLASETSYSDQIRAETEKLRAAGYRLVGGGGDGDGSWQITDADTGAVLARGDNGSDEYEQAADDLDARIGPLYHVDHIGEDIELPPRPPCGAIPHSLAEAIFGWVNDGDREDVAAFTGLPLARVRAALGDGDGCGPPACLAGDTSRTSLTVTAKHGETQPVMPPAPPRNSR